MSFKKKKVLKILKTFSLTSVAFLSSSYLSCSSSAERERVLRLLIHIIDDEVVSGADAETLLDTTQTRNMLIDELLEVHAAIFCLDVIS